MVFRYRQKSETVITRQSQHKHSLTFRIRVMLS